MPPTERRIAGHHGLGLNLVEWSPTGAGSGSAPRAGDPTPLLFLHGFGMSARVWDPFAEALAGRYRVLALDARGHGDSDHDPEFRYSHAAVTRDVECVADALGLERLSLVGHSMGGFAAMRLAARQPGRVERLVLVDAGAEIVLGSRSRSSGREPATPAFASVPLTRGVRARLPPRAPPYTVPPLAFPVAARDERGRYVPKLDPAFLRPRGEGDPEARRSFDREAWAREESERLWRALAAIPCPTLVLRGAESSALSEATARRMAEQVLAQGRALTLPGAGHAIMLDAPEALRAALLDFL